MMARPSRLKLHVFFKQRVRPDDYVRQPFRHQLLELRFLAAGERPGEQRHHISQLRENLLEVNRVLRRQDFRGREHRHLVPVFDGDHRRFRRHDGLAAAHVALQQPVHGPRLLHVVRDLLDTRFCAPVGLNGSMALTRSRTRLVDLEGDPGSVRALARFSAMPHSSQKNSSKISRNCAGVRNAFSSRRSASGGGKCVSRHGGPADPAA